MAKVLVLATNMGSWGEELQAPWDALKEAGHDLTLATPYGKKPLPLEISVDPEFFDGVQKYKTNPKEVCDRIKELVNGTEWENPKKIKECSMNDYDALVLTGGLGAMIDVANDYNTHKLILEAFYADKPVGSLCYAVAALVFCRDPKMDYKSVVYGHTITAHPRAWDFYGPDMDASYELYGATPDNKGTDVHTPGFLYPVEDLIRDAVGPNGNCVARINTSREDPEANISWPFVTAASVESSIAYGKAMVELLANPEKYKK